MPGLLIVLKSVSEGKQCEAKSLMAERGEAIVYCGKHEAEPWLAPYAEVRLLHYITTYFNSQRAITKNEIIEVRKKKTKTKKQMKKQMKKKIFFFVPRVPFSLQNILFWSSTTQNLFFQLRLP